MGKNKTADLRSQAEARLKKHFDKLEDVSGDPQRLIHELHVHQIELEMQNEELRKSQAELEESRARYSDLYDFAPVGYFTFDEHGLIIEVNLTGAGQLGVERKLLIRKTMLPFIHKDDQDVFFLHRGKVFETKEMQTCELRLKKKDGTMFFAQLQSLAVEDKAGNAFYCMTAVSDISERKRAEQALREINETLEQRVAERTEALKQTIMELEQFAYLRPTTCASPFVPSQALLRRSLKIMPEGLTSRAGTIWPAYTKAPGIWAS